MININQILFFRVTVILGTLSYLLWVFLPFFDEAWHSSTTLDVLKYDGYDAAIALPSAILWGVVIISILIAFGLFMFWRYARVLFFLMLIASTILVLFAGLRAQTELESFLFDLTNILDGIIIAMCYMSPISDKFKAERCRSD